MAVRRVESEQDTKLLEEFSGAFREREPWESIWEEVFEYYVPERLVGSNRPEPNELYNRVYDSTPSEALDQFANTLLSGLVPPWTRWVLLAPGPEVPPEKRAEVLQLLQPINDLLFLHLNFSNLHQELQPSLLDAAVSTGVIKIERAQLGGPSALKFTSVPLDAVALREGVEGTLDHVYYKTERSAGQILADVGEELPEEVRETLEQDPVKRFDVNVICRPVRPYAQRVRYVEILPQFALVIADRELPFQPFIAFRLSKVAGQAYGRGPALRQFGDTRTLNKIREYELKSAAMALLGVWVARHDGVLNPYTVDLQPGAIIPVMDTNNQNLPIRRVDDSGTAFTIGQNLTQQLRRDIKTGLYNDLFGPPEASRMTATEVMARSQIIAQSLGAIYSRLVAELLNPLIDRTLAILKSAGILAGLEDLRLDGRLIRPIYLASLAQAQRLQEMQNILQLAGISVQMGQVDQNAGMVVDYEEVVRRVAEALTVPQELLRTPEQIQQMQQQAAQALAQMQQGGGLPVGELTPIDQALAGGA